MLTPAARPKITPVPVVRPTARGPQSWRSTTRGPPSWRPTTRGPLSKGFWSERSEVAQFRPESSEVAQFRSERLEVAQFRSEKAEVTKSSPTVGDGGFPSSCSQDGTDPSPSPAYDLKTRILATMISLAPNLIYSRSKSQRRTMQRMKKTIHMELFQIWTDAKAKPHQIFPQSALVACLKVDININFCMYFIDDNHFNL